MKFLSYQESSLEVVYNFCYWNVFSNVLQRYGNKSKVWLGKVQWAITPVDKKGLQVSFWKWRTNCQMLVYKVQCMHKQESNVVRMPH